MNRRIVLLLTDLEIGGTPTVVRELAIHLHDAGAHVEVVGLSKPGPLREQLFAVGIKCTALGAGSTRDIRIIRGLHRLFKQERIDTVFSFLIHANALAAVMRIIHPQARYLQSIQTTQPWPRWHWHLQRWVRHAAEKIVVPSVSVAAAAQKWSGVRADQIVVIPNAVDVKRFQNLNRIPSNQPVIGFIGRLDRVKRIGDLLEAMTLLPGVMLKIFGQGAERVNVESTIDKLKLGDRVKLFGAIETPQEGLAQIDALVLPSEAEGFGLVLIEAMAAGVPVVATDVAGIRDVVTHEVNGLLAPVRSPAELAGAIRRVLGDQNLRERLIGAGRSHVERNYSWDHIWPQYRTLLTELA